MRKFTTILGILIMLGLTHQAFAQEVIGKDKTSKGKSEAINYRIDNMGYWMRMAKKGLVPYNPLVAVKPAEFKGSVIQFKGRAFDSPDIPVTTLSSVTESENSVFVDPDNNMYLLNSNNSTEWTGTTVGNLLGANFFQSSNAGAIWGGSPNGAGGSNSGDPATAINHAGRQFVNYIDNPGGQGVAYSDDGSTWLTSTIATNPGNLADKNHMWIDNKTTSPYVGNLYTAWTDFGGTYNYQVMLSRSTNNGLTWSSKIPVSGTSIASFNHGVNLQTGPNGQVYACWATYYTNFSDLSEDGIGFSKSLDGGLTFSAATKAISTIKGIRATGVLKSMRVNSFPVMAVDVSTGPNSGNIYIVWTNVGVPGTNSGTNKSVYIIRSTNGGTTWSTPLRVNQGAFADGKEAYSPWITCDPETGTLSVVFYDDRNTASTACETWVSSSLDAGNTWTDFRVSDVSFTPTPIPGLASSYMGDYLGITSKGGRVYPCWTDTRGGEFKTYVSPFIIGLNASFTASSTSICTGTSVTFTDNSTGPPLSWQWSFPGGTPSSYTGNTPPAITYNTPGTYNVILVVTDASGTDTETKTGFITVKNLIADFTGVPASVVVGNSVTFTNNSSCSPTGWNWSFPGGTPSIYSGSTPPAITYSTVGTYDVTLTVTKPGATDTKTKIAYITVSPPVYNMATGTVTTCSGDFYDSGGPAGSYQNNENYTETFYPSTPGAMIRFVFTSFSTESGYDYLKIYNGTSTAATLIGTYSGTTSPGTITASNASGALTFNFTSDVSLTPAGWAASISCYSPLPTVTTTAATSVTASTAVSGGNVTADGGTSVTARGVCWSTSASPDITASHTGDGSGIGTFTSSISGLSSYTTYHIRAYATNIGGTAYGSDLQFTTAADRPIITTTAPSTITMTAASSGGNVTSDGGATVSARGVCWATTVDPVATGNHTTDGTGTGVFTSSITGLTASTLYHVRAYATNSLGTAYGSDLQFSSSDLPTLSVTPSNQNVTSVAGITAFTVTSNSSWTTGSDRGWCSVTLSGTGNGTITANYTENTSVSPRIANITVTVAGLTPVIVTVTQAGVTPTLIVTPPDQPVTSAAGSTSFSVTSNTGWTAGSDQGWCTVTLSGTGNGTITANYAENTTFSPRVANVTVTVTGLTPVVVTVTQAAAAPSEFLFTIANDIQTSDRTMEFDLYLLNTNVSTPLELATIQAGVLVNPGIFGGGTITLSIVPNSSELVAASRPTTVLWVQSQNCIKLVPKTPPGGGSGTILSTTAPGTRVCRLRITNTLPFTASSTANMAFNFTTTPYPTKVFKYVGITNVALTCNAVNCYNNSSNIILNAPNKVLNLSSVFLEGLYSGAGTMRAVSDGSGAYWGATIADKITVELHNNSNYTNVMFTLPNVELSTNGAATLNVPATYSGNYYITIKHRNSIETVSALPVSFTGSTISYAFNNASKAYGSNMLLMIDGGWVIYGGDVNQDGLIDASDMAPIDNLSTSAATGYLVEDANGDGLVDAGDMAIVDNNSSTAVSIAVP